ncbi:MAG: hypothetical protein JO131_05025 [Gammaproteobacteria bacterium]|nr:hypothetical protein [Gammaproteobacteria bacterium]
MPNLSVRKLDKNMYKQLRIRAANHGVSMEEEVRQIIYSALTASENITTVFQKHFGQENGIDLDISDRSSHDPMDFNK